MSFEIIKGKQEEPSGRERAVCGNCFFQMEEGHFMDLKQLQYFVACAQTGSFSDATKVLYSTQPSVSKVIKSLEDTLGMQLFERLPRGIRLTVQGQKVYHYACRITNEIDVLENMASRRLLTVKYKL